MRVHSIRTRICGGFAALILLQAVVGVSVWRADDQVESANTADAVAEAALGRITTVRASLSLLQLALAEFVRTGLASDRERVDGALATIGKFLAEVGSGEDATGKLALSIENVRSALETAVAASVTRRDKEATLMQMGKSVEAGFASLAQAAAKSPERDTVASVGNSEVAPIASACWPPRSARARYVQIGARILL